MPGAEANPDSDCIKKLMRRFEIPLVQFANRIIGDRERAHDVVQETS
jgi:DNA-directed RNA polymerase specialized sigma24 family protein